MNGLAAIPSFFAACGIVKNFLVGFFIVARIVHQKRQDLEISFQLC
jgi:hypothetical protein